MKKKRWFSLRGVYADSFVFIKDSRNFIYSVVLVFFIFCAIALFFEDLINSFFRSVVGIDLRMYLLSILRNLIEQTRGLSYFGLMKFILLNNTLSSFYGLALGIAFAVFPLIAAIFNGYVLGFVGLLSIKAEGVFVLWRLLPHGIFELPAIFISLGLGVRLGAYFFRKEKLSFKELCLNSVKVFILVVLPLLIVASFIETSLIFLGS